MARIASPATKERHAAIVKMRVDFPNLHYQELATRCGVSVSTVQTVCRNADLGEQGGGDQGETRRRRQPDAAQPRKSDLCIAIGAVFDDHIRATRKRPDAVATNAYLVNRMTSGLHDFTTLELERIAVWMNTPVSELIRAAELKLLMLRSSGRPLPV